MTSPKDLAFRKLKAVWDQKLRKSGFRDIENSRGDLIDHQTPFDFSQRIGFRAETFEKIRDYFIWAEQMAHHGRFKTKEDKAIWLLHSEGKTSREIAKVVKLDQTWVCRKIKRIRSYLIIFQSSK